MPRPTTIPLCLSAAVALTALAGAAQALQPAEAAQTATAEPAPAAPIAHPTDEQIRARINAFTSWAMTQQPSAVHDGIGPRLVDAFDLSTLTPAQLGLLGQFLVFDGRHVPAAIAQAQAAAEGDTPEAATAATVAAWLRMKQQRVPPQASEMLDVLTHPGFDQALAQGHAYQVYELAGIFLTHQHQAETGPLLARLTELGRAIPQHPHPEGAIMAGQFAMALGERIGTDRKKEIDARAVAGIAHAAANLSADEKYIEPTLKGLSRQITFIGGPAPDIAFDWTSAGLDATSLSALKGNVVIIDFWATWCGPCISAFPKVAKVVAHYEGYPVKVLGVTSLQGFHRDLDGKRTKTENDPQAEYELMMGFIGPAGITWPVVFADDSAMNDYSVRGIPHLAFIAPDGTVRHNGLNPHALTFEQEQGMINDMLKEFGLPYPGMPTD